MHEPDARHRLPDAERLSVLTATILLAYALSNFINLPGQELALQLPGFYLSAQIDEQTIVGLLIAFLTASGANWMLRDHPALGERSTFEHWLLPALTAWVIALPLSQLPLGLLWWAGFALGGISLILVLLAEYITIDPQDAWHPPAAAGLTAMSFALYLVLAAALSFAGMRLFLLLPILSLAAGLVSLRSLRFRLHDQWAFIPAGVTALVVAQIAAPLHYWPVSPVAFGLAVLGPAYALTSLTSDLAEGEPLRGAIAEPLVVLMLVWLAAFLLR
ncbi:MAG: hypothetical protein JXA78_16655 [Anaerolineales bacterium]|nr:hypothetical protein [Anaerolineales bacterium]